MGFPAPPYHHTINKLLYAILRKLENNPVSMTIPGPPYYNVTNELLWAILGKLNGSTTVYTGFRVLYVSSRYGDDSTAEPNNVGKPFRSIMAAKRQALFTDIIHVLEGEYNEANLFGYLRYWFDFGAEVNYSGSGAIFQQASGECLVRGFGRFRCTGAGSVINAGNWNRSVLDLECETIESVSGAVNLWQNVPAGQPSYKPHKIKAKRIYSSEGEAVLFRYNAHAEVESHEITTDGVGKPAIFVGNIKSGVIRNSNITSNNHSVANFIGAGIQITFENCTLTSNWNDPLGHCIYITNVLNNLYLSNTRFTCVHPDAKSILTGSGLNVHLDNNVRANRDIGSSGTVRFINKDRKILLDNPEAVIDITGQTSINLAAFKNAEIIRLTSANATEDISQIIGAPDNHSFILIPAPTLTLRLASANTISENSLVLSAANLRLNGAKGDWIELQKSRFGTGNRQVNLMNY